MIVFYDIGHSLGLNAEVEAKALQISGSLVVGVKIILQVVILFFFDVPCNKLTKKMEKNVQNHSSCGSALGTALSD